MFAPGTGSVARLRSPETLAHGAILFLALAAIAAVAAM
jgi:hypothetical protein